MKTPLKDLPFGGLTNAYHHIPSSRQIEGMRAMSEEELEQKALNDMAGARNAWQREVSSDNITPTEQYELQADRLRQRGYTVKDEWKWEGANDNMTDDQKLIEKAAIEACKRSVGKSWWRRLLSHFTVS